MAWEWHERHRDQQGRFARMDRREGGTIQYQRKTVSFRLPTALVDKLRAAAPENKMEQTEIVQQALVHYLEVLQQNSQDVSQPTSHGTAPGAFVKQW